MKRIKKKLPHRIDYPLNIIVRKLRIYVDRRAMIKGTNIIYSLYDFRTKIAKRMTLELPEILHIFHELNPRPTDDWYKEHGYVL